MGAGCVSFVGQVFKEALSEIKGEGTWEMEGLKAMVHEWKLSEPDEFSQEMGGLAEAYPR